MMGVHGLARKYIQPRSRKLAVGQGLIESFLVHQRAPRHVNEESFRFEERQAALIDDLARARIQVQVQRKEIALPQHSVQVLWLAHGLEPEIASHRSRDVVPSRLDKELGKLTGHRGYRGHPDLTARDSRHPP